MQMIFLTKTSFLDSKPMACLLKKTCFALKSFIDFSPLEVLDNPNCLIFVLRNEDKRGEGHGKILMKTFLEYFQITIHS